MGRRKKKTTHEQLDVDVQSPARGGKKAERQRRGANNGRKNRHEFGNNGDEEFRAVLEADGSKQIMEMAADGNCLFRALSDQLFWDHGYNHEEVRSDVCDFLEMHEDEFSVFLVLDENEDDEDAADFESYISGMRDSGEWGGNLELVAAARLYRRNIKAFSLAAAYTIEHGADKSAGPDLMVSYHDNDHYNSVRARDGKRPVPAKKFLSTQKKSTDTVATEKTEDEFEVSSDIGLNGGNEGQNRQKEDPPEQGAQEVKKPRKKGGPCPCGSRKTYRRCCKDKDKKQQLAQRKQLEPSDDDAEEAEDPPQEIEDGFKVLRI